METQRGEVRVYYEVCVLVMVVCQYSVSVDGPVTVTVSTCETIGLRKAEQKAEPSNLTDAGL